MAFGFSFMKALPWPQGKYEGYACIERDRARLMEYIEGDVSRRLG
jgi:hypothetical protein